MSKFFKTLIAVIRLFTMFRNSAPVVAVIENNEFKNSLFLNCLATVIAASVLITIFSPAKAEATSYYVLSN